MRCKAPDGSLLHGDEYGVLLGQAAQQLRVQGLAEAGVNHRGAHTVHLAGVGVGVGLRVLGVD